MTVHAMLRAGDAVRADLDNLQLSIAVLQGEIKALEQIPLAIDEWRALVVEQFDRHTVGHGPAGWFASMRHADAQLRAPAWRGDVQALPAIDAVFLAWLLGGPGPLFDKVLERMPEAAADAGITALERAAKGAALQTRLREFELAEAREMVRLEDLGHVVCYRDGMKTEILLEVWGEPGTEDRQQTKEGELT